MELRLLLALCLVAVALGHGGHGGQRQTKNVHIDKYVHKNHWLNMWKPWRHNRCHRNYYECMVAEPRLARDVMTVGEGTCTMDGSFWYTGCWKQFHDNCYNYPIIDACPRGCVMEWRDQYEESEIRELWQGATYTYNYDGYPYHGIFTNNEFWISLPCLNPLRTGFLIRFDVYIGHGSAGANPGSDLLQFEINGNTEWSGVTATGCGASGWSEASPNPFSGGASTSVCMTHVEIYYGEGDTDSDNTPRLNWSGNFDESTNDEWWGVGNIIVYATTCASGERFVAGDGCIPGVPA